MKAWPFHIVLCVMCIVFGSERTPVQDSMVDTSRDSLIRIDSGWLSRQNFFAYRSVNAMYRKTSYALAWHDGQKLLPRALILLEMLRQADNYGLIKTEYPIRAMDSLVVASHASAAAIARSDVILTDSYFKFASHLRHGRLRRGDGSIRPSEDEIDTIVLRLALDSATSTDFRQALENIQPLDVHFRALSKTFRASLVQYKHNLIHEDGNPTIKSELLKRAINLERLRWDNGRFPSQYVLVNIPAFELNVYEFDSVVLSSKVIVGSIETPTPELSSRIFCFRVYPYWHVPRNIATREILPILKRDPGYLERMRFEVLDPHGQSIDATDIDWTKYSTSDFPLIFRQREGTDNSLGIVKFEFENRYGVYLHDTNAKSPFNRQVRALSHGCVRMEKATDLAHYLNTTNGGGITEGVLTGYFHAKKRRDVNLTRGVEILIRYWTANAEFFYPDIYQYDQTLLDSSSDFFNEYQPYEDDSRFILGGSNKKQKKHLTSH